jgi:REP element-mobilizing transposase RayT
MPRQSRLEISGALHHIIARDIERRTNFEDDQGRQDFLKNLCLILEQTETACYAWSLMSNHFHRLLKTGGVAIAIDFQKIRFARQQGVNRPFSATPDR